MHLGSRRMRHLSKASVEVRQLPGTELAPAGLPQHLSPKQQQHIWERTVMLTDAKLAQAADEIAARRGVRHKTELINQAPPAICADSVRDRCTAAKPLRRTAEQPATRRRGHDEARACMRAQVVAAATEAVVELGASHQRMVSRAYHDALFMSQVRVPGRTARSSARCAHPSVVAVCLANIAPLHHYPLSDAGMHMHGHMSQVAPTAMIFIPCRNGWSHRPGEFASPEDIERGVKALALTLARLAGDAGVASASEHSEL